MSEFPHGSHSRAADPSGEPIQGHLTEDPEYTADELAEDFADWLSDMDAENFDEETLDAFLEELDRQDPLSLSFDVHASLEAFHEKFSPLFAAQSGEPVPRERGKRRLFLRAVTAAATIAVMLASMMTAQAFGLDVFGFFASWTNDIFFFSKNQEAPVYPLAEGESAEFDTIEDALSAFNIDTPMAPSWYPDRIGEFEVTGSVANQTMEICATSGGENSDLLVSYSEFSDQSGPLFVIEKDQNNITLYEKDGHSHYIMADNGLSKATWVVDNIQCIIFGTVSQDEMIKIIDSIYEVV